MLSQFSGMYPVTKTAYLEANKQGTIHPEQAELLGGKIGNIVGFMRLGINLKQAFLYFTISLFLGFALISMQQASIYIIGGFALPLLVFVVVSVSKRISNKTRRANLQQELLQGKIEHGVGSLKFGKDSYYVELADKQLAMPFVSKEDLNPGVSYMFYYLPVSGIVLSAEELRQTPTADVNSGFNGILAEANGFKQNSLEANKRGELTAEQISGIYSHLISPLIFIGMSLAVIYFIVRRLDIDGPFSMTAYISALLESTSGMKVFGGIFLVLLVWGLVLLTQTLLDIFGKTLSMVEGQGYRKISTTTDDDGSKTVRMYYVINGVKFSVERRGFLAFEDGRQYKAYFTPRRKVLVNIEAV